MSEGNVMGHICRKETEVAKLTAEVKTLKTIVMGNGRPGLNTTVPELNTSVKTLTDTIGTLTTGVSGLLKFQENQLGLQAGKSIVRKRDRWIIGLLITVILGMGAGIIAISIR